MNLFENFSESTANTFDQESTDPIMCARKIIGNREDITLIYRKTRDYIWENKTFQIFSSSLSDDGCTVTITIMNLWKMCKSGESFWLEEYDLHKKKWKKLSVDAIPQFPRINVYPIVPHTGFIHGHIHNAVEKIARHYGYDGLKADMVSDKKTLTKSAILTILYKYLKKVIGHDNLAIKAKLLRSQFYQYFYDKTIVKALMSINYRYVGFDQYFTCLMLKKDFSRVYQERKNLLPIFLNINPCYWSRRDLFSRNIWCKQGKKYKLSDLKKFTADDMKIFTSFDDVSVFRWLFNQKISVIKSWLTHRQVAHLSLVKKAVEAMTSSPSTYALYALIGSISQMSILVRNRNLVNDLHFLFRAFLNESNRVWEKEGYPTLRKWVVLNVHRMTSFYDYLLNEGFEKKILNKKLTWQSIKSKSDEWHARMENDRIAKATMIRMNLEKLEWVSLIKHFEVTPIVFTAIDTYTALYQESLDMHHCVVDYLEHCLSDYYRVFHINDGSGNEATLGIYLRSDSWCINQIQAACNEMTTREIIKACDLLLKEYNLVWKQFAPHVNNKK